MLVDRSLRDLLAAFASSDPTPGGGSAAAAASAIGAALLTMVAGLPKTRNGTAEDRLALDDARGHSASVQQRLTEAIDADTAAYDAVVAAYRMPKTNEAAQAVRKDAIQAALRRATDVPMQVAQSSVEALETATVVATHGHKAAASDIGVAVALLAAGFHGARLNVETNVESIADVDYRERIATSLARLAADATRFAAAAQAALTNR